MTRSMTPASPFSSIEEAIAEIAAGRMLVVVDDEDRENEGDFVMAAEKVTPEAVNFMATHGRGLICLPLTGERLDAARIPPMTDDEHLRAGHRVPRARSARRARSRPASRLRTVL